MARIPIYLVVEQTWEYNDEYYFEPENDAYTVNQAYIRREDAETEARQRQKAALRARLEAGDLKEWDEGGLMALTSHSKERFTGEVEALGLEYDTDEDDVIWPPGAELTASQLEGLCDLFDELCFFRVEETVLVH